MDRRHFIAGAAAGTALSLNGRAFAQAMVAAPNPPIAIQLHLDRAPRPLPHNWEHAGSDRVAVGLREQWRQDLVRVKQDTGVKTIRSHGLFNDEMGIASRGAGNFNFNYVDQIYDFMLDNGVRPFVELSFMPEALASAPNRIFFYRANISPPRNWSEWRDMVQAFTAHCVKRYGIAEVSGWDFEVWNEPNLDFWAGSQAQYFELYRASAEAVKAVDRRLRVGGPATAQLAWIPDLIAYCSRQGVPLDFITSHVYPTDPQKILFGADRKLPLEQVTPAGVLHIKQQVEASKMPGLPVMLTEWSSQNPAFIAETVSACTGVIDRLSYWAFSNVFEELGPPGLFNKRFGMLDQRGIARPSLHVFAMLHRLGELKLATGAGPVLATRRADGSLAILVWNLLASEQASRFSSGNPITGTSGGFDTDGPSREIQLGIPGWKGRNTARVSQVNGAVGNAFPAWTAMGSPEYPSEDQIASLRRSAEMPPPQTMQLMGGVLSLSLAPNGVALIELDA